ncbi:hypothetical protein Sjap_016795 [Stephania japonica]|uniref:PROP1-like PPR domain-containing protein n=1 Tax=Stephania japonica TaxID=461633 RepID=A0AAP0I532_9MAGN
MDVSLSAKSQTLSLISSFSLASSPSSIARSYALPREFLGSTGHRLRPPGLTSRRKCAKLGFQIRRHRFLCRASLASEPVVVIVAFAALSAFAVLYLKYVRGRRSDGDLSGSKDLNSLRGNELIKLWRGSVKQSIEALISAFGEFNAEAPVIERNIKNEETSEGVLTSEARDIQNQGAGLMYEETLLSEASQLSFSPKESETIGSELRPLVADEFSMLKPLYVEVKLPEVQPEKCPVEVAQGSELPGQEAELVSSASLSLGNATVQKNEDLSQSKHEVGKGVESPYDRLFKSSTRKELYTFYGENQSQLSTVSTLRNLNDASPRSLQHRTRLSSLLKPNALKGVDTQGSFHTSEVQMPLAHYREGSYHKGKHNDTESPRDAGNGFHLQNSEKDKAKPPHINGRRTANKHDPSEYLTTYNVLLRDGRLAKCIELLETMEQRGLLDTDKIYHSKFFNTCKSQKAVKEAFQFINLIRNPTLSTFNMLLAVCASSQDSEGAFKVLQLVKDAGLKADCKLYTTLITTCAKSGKVDAMFGVFHDMVNAGVEPNLHTYGALIDGCARVGQVAKAFGAYGILRSKKVKPDRVIFNALITACGQSGAVDRAFDVLGEMRAEATPIDPDHVTVGALMKTCIQAGEFDRAREVYEMIHTYNIKGTPEVYTIAVSSCSQMGDLDFAFRVYEDMRRNGVVPDEMFVSALIDVAGHAGKVDAALKFLEEARARGIKLGNIAYSSLMGACSNAKDWQKALEVYEDIRAIRLKPTTSTLNALITALCNGVQLHKAVEVHAEMKKAGVHSNIVTYAILLVASEKKDELEIGLALHSQAKEDGAVPHDVTYKCLLNFLSYMIPLFDDGIEMVSLKGHSNWVLSRTSLALTIYREMILAGVVPNMEVLSLVLGCLQFPHDSSLRARFIANLGVMADASRCSNICSLLDGFGEYDPRSFSLLEEAASLGIVLCVSFRRSPIVVDARKLQVHTVEVYLITILKGLKHRLAAGAKLPNITILLPVENTQTQTPIGLKTIKVAGRVGQAVGALLRRLGLPYQGDESYGKIRINGLAIRRWFQPKLASPFTGNPSELNSSPTRLAKGITNQQRIIRTSNFSTD